MEKLVGLLVILVIVAVVAGIGYQEWKAVHAPVVAPSAPTVVPAEDLPDPALTPGVGDPRVTQETLKATVCVGGYTKTVRPPPARVGGSARRLVRLVVTDAPAVRSEVLSALEGAGRGLDFSEGGIAWANHQLVPEGRWDKDALQGLQAAPVQLWEELAGSVAIRRLNLRLPAPLHAQLRMADLWRLDRVVPLSYPFASNVDLFAPGSIDALAVAALVVGILGILLSAVLAYLFYRRSNRDKLLSWAIITTTVVEPVNPVAQLTMLYAGTPIDRLSVSLISVWNAGRGAIDGRIGGDVSATQPLAIVSEVPGVKILDVEVIRSDPGISVERSPGMPALLQIKFEFLNYRQGCLVRILHTGRSSNDLALMGTILGVDRFRCVDPTGSDIPFAIKVAAVVVPLGERELIDTYSALSKYRARRTIPRHLDVLSPGGGDN